MMTKGCDREIELVFDNCELAMAQTCGSVDRNTRRAGARGRPTLREMGETGQRTRLIATPVFAASVGLLLLNDHVFKAAWPGRVTGKLSDVAGIAMVAIMLTALLRHRVLAFGITIVAFTALKVVPQMAVVAAPLLGGVTRTDPTDVIALLVLLPVGAWMVRPVRPVRPSPTPVRRQIEPGRGDRLTVRAMLIGAAIFATSATSGDCGPTGVWSVEAIDGVVYARSDQSVWTSADGGVTWRSSELTVDDSRFSNGPLTESCVDEQCFGIVRSTSDSSFSVVESAGGDTTKILEIDHEQRREFARKIQPSCSDESGRHLAAVDVAGGVHVIVSMGEAGTLHRPPGGQWEWVAVGRWGVGHGAASADSFLTHPIAARPDGSPFSSLWVARALLWAAPIIAFGASVPLAAVAGRRGRSRGFAIALSVLLGVAVLAPSLLALRLLDGASDRDAGTYSIVGGVLVLLAVVGVGGLVAWFVRDARPLRPDPGWTTRTSTSVAPSWPPPRAPSTPPSDEPVE